MSETKRSAIRRKCEHCGEAADEIERLRAESAKTEGLLKCQDDVIEALQRTTKAATLPMLVRACVKAFKQLNTIRARDGVPRNYCGDKTGVDAEYFSSVVDELDAAVRAATGKSAHCHPELYKEF